MTVTETGARPMKLRMTRKAVADGTEAGSSSWSKVIVIRVGLGEVLVTRVCVSWGGVGGGGGGGGGGEVVVVVVAQTHCGLRTVCGGLQSTMHRTSTVMAG